MWRRADRGGASHVDVLGVRPTDSHWMRGHPMNAITATATRWEHGWELAIGGEIVTQSRTLATARQQVRDYLDTVDPGTDHGGWVVALVTE